MKELTKYSRLAGYLEKLYDKLNADFLMVCLTVLLSPFRAAAAVMGTILCTMLGASRGRGIKKSILPPVR